MVDFTKKLSPRNEPKIDPIEIYDSLDRASDKGPLRPAQETILREWFSSRRNDKDTVIKLHTGQGKTLIGLLTLQSKLNENKSPVIYLCPNIYLAEQTCAQATQFGIKFCKIGLDNQIPQDFWTAKSIFITHAQKLFNGLSQFGIGNSSSQVDTILLDDSHSCIDVIQDAFSIKISRTYHQDLFDEIFNLFEKDLEDQGAAKVEEIKQGDFDSFLHVPYWAWQDKQKEIISIITKNKQISPIKFPWELIKDIFKDCQCYISGTSIEILPYSNPIELFGSFFKAKHRIFMSATTNNDSFFIKGLGVDSAAIKNPLTYKKEKWSGEKMILIPYLMNESLNRIEIVNAFAKPDKKRKYGIVALTPSSRATDYWQQCGALVPSEEVPIDVLLNSLKQGKYENTVAIANRYDGIDLPDNACRVLIIDSKPYGQTLMDKYNENCREGSQLVQIKIAQKIEQGLGRGVRGEKDYCVIIITSPSLINNVRGRQLKRFFSPQTNKQIEIGFEVAQLAAEQAKTDNGFDSLNDLINQSLNRDDGWKGFYIDKMNEIEEQIPETENTLLETLSLERDAEIKYRQGDNAGAKDAIQRIINNLPTDNKSERGWYTQEKARYFYTSSKTDSNKMQVAAHSMNRYLLKPLSGMEVKRLEIHKSRVEGIKDWLTQFDNYEQVKIRIEEILADLSFGIKADKFEQALCDLGKALGFESERPDKEWKKGPDNLWNLKPNEYILFECKSEVDEKRAEIDKAETGQMNNSCAWFKTNYNSAKVKNIIIIPPNSVSGRAGFTEPVEVMKKSKLQKLTQNVRTFFNEFKSYDITTLTDSQITEYINTHGLSIDKILSDYSEKPYQRK